MKEYAQCLANAVDTFFPTFKRIWGWVFMAGVLDQLFSFLLEYLKEKDESLVIGLGVIYFVFHLAVASLLVICVNQAYFDSFTNKRSNLPDKFKLHFKGIVIESARALGWIMLGLLLFVIPGIHFSFVFYWVVYIVQFDPRYDSGRIDALQTCKQLLKGRYLWAVGALAIGLVCDWGSQFLLTLVNPLKSPALFCGAFGLTVVAAIYSSGFLLFAYFHLESHRQRSHPDVHSISPNPDPTT